MTARAIETAAGRADPGRGRTPDSGETLPFAPVPGRTARRRRDRVLSPLTSSFARAATATVLLLSALAASVALLAANAAPTRWTTTAEVAPQLSLLDGSSGTNVFSLNIDGAKRFIDSQVALMKGREVAAAVRQATGLTPEDLKDRVKVTPGLSGATVLVTTTDPDRTSAYELANAVVDSYRTVRGQQLRALAKTRYDVISSQLDQQRLLGLSTGELALQLQRDLAAILVPLNAGPAATLTVVSSAGLPEPAPRGALLKAILAFVATAAAGTSVLLVRRAIGDRVLDPRDIAPEVDSTVLGLFRRHDGPDVAADRVATLLSLGGPKPTEILVLSALPEPLDEQAAHILLAGLRAAGRPAQLVAAEAQERLADHVHVTPRGWATQLPELDLELGDSVVLCLALVQGMSAAEVHAAVASVRHVTALPLGLLLLQGRTLP